MNEEETSEDDEETTDDDETADATSISNGEVASSKYGVLAAASISPAATTMASTNIGQASANIVVSNQSTMPDEEQVAEKKTYRHCWLLEGSLKFGWQKKD